MPRRYRDTGVDEKWVGYVITRPRLKERDHVTEIRTEIQSDLIPNTKKASLFSPRVGGSGQKLRTTTYSDDAPDHGELSA